MRGFRGLPAQFENTGKFAGGRRVYRLTSPLVYEIGDSSLLSITVGSGFETDLASVPWFGRVMFLPSGEHAPAAIMHDKLYRDRCLSRRLSDLLFYEAVCSLGVPTWRAWILYLAVRFGGSWYLRK